MIKTKVLKYTVIYTLEPEGGFTVTVPSLPGCVTYGKDLAEAKKMAEDASGFIWRVYKNTRRLYRQRVIPLLALLIWNFPKLMPKTYTPKEVIAKLKKLGFKEDRQSGSHKIFYNSQTSKRAVIPYHLK